MKLIVIRHGETDLNKEDRLQGSRGENLPLNETGKKEISTLRDSLLVIPEIIFASPLRRTQQTAEILNQRFGVKIVFSPLLMERDFGILSGEKRSALDPKIILDDLEGHYDYHSYGGESVEDVTKRVKQFIESLRFYQESNIMIVTHRGIIRILYDLYPNNVTAESILPGSKHVFDLTPPLGSPSTK